MSRKPRKRRVEYHAIPSPHERIGDHVRRAGLWTQHGGIQDSGFEAYLDTRLSASGAVVMLVKEAVCWHSRMQEVTTSGTSQAVKEVILLRQLQDFMKLSMRIGVVDVFEDNKGAIKLAVN